MSRSHRPAYLYVSDLDGTLLQADGFISDYALRELGALLDVGLPFTVASARSVSSIREVLRGLPIRLPVISFNGAFLSDLASGEHHMIHAMAAQTALAARALIDAAGLHMFVSTHDGHSDHLYYSDTGNAGMQFYRDERLRRGDPRLHQLPALDRAFDEAVICLTVIASAAELLPLEAAIKQACGEALEMHLVEDLYQHGWFWLTLHDSRASKDRGIAALRQHQGMGAHQLMVFGDQMNDLKMFHYAEHAVAVANADARLLAAAHRVIGAHGEDSVTRYISQHWQAHLAAA